MKNSSVKEIVEWVIAKGKEKASSRVAVIHESENYAKSSVLQPGWLQSHGPEIYHECDRHTEVSDSLIYTGNDRDYWSIQLTF